MPTPLEFSPASYEAGKLYAGEIITFAVKVKNLGKQSFLVTKVLGSCDCLKADPGQISSLAPNADFTVNTTLKTVGMTGHFSRDVIIEGELGTNHVVQAFTVRGEMFPAVDILRADTIPGDYTGKSVERTITFESKVLPGDALQIDKITSTDDATLKGTTWTREPLQAGQKGEFRYRYSPKSKEDYHQRLFIEFSKPRKFSAEFHVFNRPSLPLPRKR